MELIKKLILNEIDKLNKNNNNKRVYKIKYSNEYYVNMMIYLLKDINNWSFLQNIKGYGNGNNNDNIPKYHYVTIKNKFNLWSKLGVFEKAYMNYTNNTITTNLLYIDATSINNKKGSENIVINPENKKKKVTKLSVITNDKGFILSIVPFNINKTLNDGKTKTAVHDVKMINKSINDIIQIKNNSKNYYLIGDKAYKNQMEIKLNNKHVKMITPDKKNTVNKNTKFKNKKLKKRIVIEHANLNIKRYERINTRKEVNINTFMSWVYIGSLITNIRINKKYS